MRNIYFADNFKWSVRIASRFVFRTCILSLLLVLNKKLAIACHHAWVHKIIDKIMDRVRRPLILLHKECYYPLQYSSCFSDAYELRFYNYREWNCALTRGIRVRARARVLMKPMKHCTVISIEFGLTQRTRKILPVSRYGLYLRFRCV